MYEPKSLFFAIISSWMLLSLSLGLLGAQGPLEFSSGVQWTLSTPVHGPEILLVEVSKVLKYVSGAS